MNEEGAFLLIELTAKVQETEEIIDTTDENTAKEAKVFNEAEVYSPRLFILGSDDAPKPLTEALKQAEPGSKNQVIVPPEQGYGPRDPSKVRVFPLRRFADVRDLDVNSKVEVDGKIGVVKSITSGRVSVDFNPPLAGRTIVYDVELLSTVQGDLERIRALIGRRFPRVDADTIATKLEDSMVEIRLPEEVFYSEGLQMTKRALFSEITKHLKDVTTVRFVEEYSMKREEKKEEEKKEEPKRAEDKTEEPKEKPTRKKGRRAEKEPKGAQS